MQTALVNSVELMAQGRIILPQNMRDALGLKAGDKVTFIQEDNKVIMMHSAVYAMQMLQDSMHGEAAKAGLHCPDDVDSMLMRMRIKDAHGTTDGI